MWRKISDSSLKGNAADSLLPIVASQRERFRQRVQELEEVAIKYKNTVRIDAKVFVMYIFQQNLQYQQHMALLQTEIEKMRSDNVKLFEKIRFLQSYSAKGAGQTVNCNKFLQRCFKIIFFPASTTLL